MRIKAIKVILPIILFLQMGVSYSQEKINLQNILNKKNWAFVSSASVSDEFNWDYYLDESSIRRLGDDQIIFVTKAFNKGSHAVKTVVVVQRLKCNEGLYDVSGFRERFDAQGISLGKFGDLNSPSNFKPIVSKSVQAVISLTYCPKFSTFANFSSWEEFASNTSLKNNNALPELSDLNAAKVKCIELGFKKDTEPFGKCVLRLSK